MTERVVVAAGRGDEIEILSGADATYRIGSITKPVTAAIVLDVAEPERSVEDYLPGWGGPREVTVAMLLAHTSGLRNHAAEPAFNDWIRREPSRRFEPEEIWHFGLDLGLAFPPGTDQLYSTTGYIVAGRVVEAITGQPAHVAIRERVLAPLGLDDSYLPPHEVPPSPAVPGFVGELAVADHPQTALQSVGWTGGGLEATARDTVRIIPGVLRAEMVEVSGREGYGMGLRVRSIDDHICYSHTGLTVGYRSAAAFLPELDVSVAVLANTMDYPVWGALERAVRRMDG